VSGLHQDAVRSLQDWTAPDPEQDLLRRDYLDHLLERSDGMYRSCRPAHITASALVVDIERGRVLLTLHPKVGRWLQLGGHCEPEDATLAAAALREATEESGITVGLALFPDRSRSSSTGTRSTAPAGTSRRTPTWTSSTW